MSLQSIHHAFLVGAYGAASVAHAYCVTPSARAGLVVPAWLAWPKLIIFAATAIKVGALAVDLQVISALTFTLLMCGACAAFHATSRFQPQKLISLLDALNTPVATYILGLVSAFVDILATSLLLTFVSALLQGLIAVLACSSMLCSVWLLVLPSDHSIEVTKMELLSVQHPLTSYYDFTMSILCDDLLDAKVQDNDHMDDGELEHLLEFREFLFDKRNLVLPLHSLLWTLRRPAVTIMALSALVALIVCSQAALLYTALFLLANRTTTAYAAFLHNVLSFGLLYYAMAATESKMCAEKIFRLSQSTATDVNLNSFLSTELQSFVECVSTVPVGLINMFEMCGSIFSLTFVIGGFAYFTLISILVYFGYLAYATTKISITQNDVAEKQKKRLTATHAIMRNLLAIKTLGLQSYYLSNLMRLRKEENNAKGTRREQLSQATTSLFICYSAFTLMVLCGLAYHYSGSAITAEDIFPILMVLSILGSSIGEVKLSITSWSDFQYLQRCMDLLNTQEIPLRFEDKAELNPSTQIRICNLTSRHTTKPDTLFLKEVNIELFRGDFALIFGRTGSGKTTFLQAILGEQKMTTGSIHVADASLAYCGQDAWLPDVSILLCITGGNAVDEARYRMVVNACRLPAEMSSLAYSNSTQIGPNGCLLSRTDRAKMALARAAYAGASIVLLDDPFAAFDATESAELARNLLNPTDGLLRLGNTTVVLASHSFPVPTLVDVIYCLATNQFITYPIDEDHESSEHASTGHSMTTESFTTTSPSTMSTANRDGKCCTGEHEAQYVSLQKNVAFIWKTMADQPGCKRLVLVLLCFTIVEAPLVYGTVAWPQFTWSMTVSVVLQLLLSIVYCWVSLETSRVLDTLWLQFGEVSHRKIATMVMKSNPSSTFQLTAAQLLNLLGSNLEVLDNSPYRLFRFIYGSGCVVVSLILLFCSTNYSLTAVLSIIVCVATVEHAWNGASKRATECSDHAFQKLNDKFAEITEGLAYIRGFGWERHMLRQLTSATGNSETALRTALSLHPWFEMSMALCWTGMATTLVAYTYCHKDQISPNMLGLGLLALLGLPKLASNVLSISMEIKELVTGTDRIRQFMTTTEEASKAGTDPMAENESWGTLPEIEFTNAEIGAITPLNGKIRGAGQVLIQGANGSGKTRLLLALLGKSNYKGSIRIGDVEVRDLSSDVLSRVVSILPQDPVALPGTFEKNLFLTKYTDPDLEVEPIDKFLNGILDKLDLLHLTEPADEGFERLVSEMRLSQGQIALLNLARCAIDVLGKKTRIVVIDDMFSKLDREYADMAKAFISRAFRACIVVIAETTSRARLLVKGLTPLDAEYPNSDVHDALKIAAINEEVRQWHKAGRDTASTFFNSSTSPSVSSAEPSFGVVSEPSAVAPPVTLPDHLSSSAPLPAPSATPPTSPRPDPSNPWFEPRRPAPRPPANQSVAATPVELPQEIVKTTIVQYDPSIFDSEPSDPSPNGPWIHRERFAMGSMPGIPSDNRANLSQRGKRQIYPGTYPVQNDEGEDSNGRKKRPIGPREAQLRKDIGRFIVGYVLLVVFVLLLFAIWS